MSHGKIRHEKNCLNCNANVENRFCPKCGQENIETRQPFHYLFTHFVEDFTHYDGQFWRTMKNLLFKPGKLTTIYLSGKRQQYVPPVKLYIFISFLTFFISALLPSDNVSDDENFESKTEALEEEKVSAIESLHQIKKENIISKDKSLDILKKIPVNENKNSKQVTLNTDFNTVSVGGINKLEEFDQKFPDFPINLARPLVKKYFHLQEEGFTHDEISEKFSDTFMHSLPKALFIYLPLFALFMWLFHDKKKWFYYDHGIFTLHYFTFILSLILSLNILDSIEDFANNNFVTLVYGMISVMAVLYMIYYFFRAHKNIYGYKKSTTLFKGTCLFIVNSISLFLLFLSLFAISFLMIH